MTDRRAYAGPALFSAGFRPFFLAAALFGLGVVPAWFLVWRGDIPLAGPFSPVDWHIHEMLFGYASAVIAGFLFTAVPNWTGRMPTRGWPLMALLALWVLGRLATAGALPAASLAAMAIDCAFLLAIALMIVVEIVAGRNWRNLKVVIPVLILFAANVTFQLEAMLRGSADVGRRLGFAVVIFLIMLIGGRIIPSFTRNWLAQQGAVAMPAPFGRFDGFCILSGAVAMVVWTALPTSRLAASLLVLAAVLHFVRLWRWRGAATWRSPLLLMLHAAYLFVPLGLAATGAGAAGLLPPAAGFHLLGIGAIGGMTVAVMMRATRGHTGRTLVAGGWLSAAFVLILAAALVRALAPSLELGRIDGIAVSAALWTLGYAIFALRLAPWLALPSPARRRPNRPGAPA
jgi:uncharacterized protein involved in response to NO